MGLFAATGMPDTDWWEALWVDPEAVLHAVGLRAGMEAIDLCSGDGWFTLPMAKIARHVTAMEIDAALLERSRRRLAEQGVGNCTFVRADAYDLPDFVAHDADFVFLANVFHGVQDQKRLAGAVHDVLVPGGRFVIVNWHRRAREETCVLGEPRGPGSELRMSPDETTAAVSTSGFGLETIVELPPYHYGAIFLRSAD